jgi:glutathione reductase (NADPH)
MTESMRRQFDLVVIGTGSAAGVVAHKCRRAGWSVAVIDSRPFGGTCALRGCDPKKVLIGAAEAVDQVNLLREKGVRADALGIEWSELMRFKRAVIETVPAERENGFARAGIETFHGRARFVGPDAVTVGDQMLEGRHLLIAAGAKPTDLGIEGREHLVTSEQFLEIGSLSRRVLFVGGGYISFEFGHVAARVGAEVTIVHRGQRPLNAFDPDLVDLLVARSRALGIDVRLGGVVTKIEKAGAVFTVHIDAQNTTLQLEAEMVVHGAGRVPEIDDLNLDAAGVRWDQHGVTVNQYLQSVSNPAVYAAGDAAASGAPRLTPVAGYQGRIVAANLLDEKNRQSPDYTVVPSVAFTVPPLASVGLLERVAESRGLAFDVHQSNTASWYSSRRVGETHSGFKVLVEKSSERILGAHVLGPHADDVINVFAMAMRTGTTAASLKEILFAYPTAQSDIPYMV